MTIQVRELEHCYAGAATPTLEHVSFVVPRGALAVVLGPSGAGKSTLLRCLAGLDARWRGTIEIEELRVVGDGLARPRRFAWRRDGHRRRAHLQARLRGRVGLVFQTLELFPHLSALDNCLLAPLRVRRAPRAAAEARARELLAALELADKTDAYPPNLSGGQRQRVAIARALAMEPRVLLYDEPTSALDPSLKDEVVEALRRVRAAGVTQIIVTHDTALAAAADLVFILARGRITAVPAT